MTDSKLRELERRWKETGSVEDEARYLLERVRVGDLERERLELAAYCGHDGAREALSRGPRENLGITARHWKRPPKDAAEWAWSLSGACESWRPLLVLALAAIDGALQEHPALDEGLEQPLNEARRMLHLASWAQVEKVRAVCRTLPEPSAAPDMSTSKLLNAVRLLGSVVDTPARAAENAAGIAHHVSGIVGREETIARMRAAVLAWCLPPSV